MTRVLDVLLATCALIVLSPIMAIVAILVAVTSSGPALYAQVRVGRYGAPFRILKFRTMVKDADRLGSTVTTRRDLRTTTVGRALRRLKIDELPQLVNVIRGDMSIVGPRPDVPEVIAIYSTEMRRVLDIRPGMTSIASMDLTSEESLLDLVSHPEEFYIKVVVPAKVAVAMRHVDNQSTCFYLVVIFMTIRKLLESVFGVSTPGPLTRYLTELATKDATDLL